MRITFQLLQEMKEQCRRSGADFLVVVIPTKEMVFAEELEKRPDMLLGDVISKLLVNERKARARTFEFLQRADIGFVDTLPALTAARGAQLYARTAADMHPNGNGYQVIAQAVASALEKQDATKHR